MIDVKITRAEALLIVELVQKSAKELSEALLIAVEEQNDKEQLAKAANQNYVVNLEAEVKRLTKLVNEKTIDETPPSKPMSTYRYCANLVKDMNVGETRTLQAPNHLPFGKFRSSLSAAISYMGKFKTKGNSYLQTITVTKLKDKE